MDDERDDELGDDDEGLDEEEDELDDEDDKDDEDELSTTSYSQVLVARTSELAHGSGVPDDELVVGLLIFTSTDTRCVPFFVAGGFHTKEIGSEDVSPPFTSIWSVALPSSVPSCK